MPVDGQGSPVHVVKEVLSEGGPFADWLVERAHAEGDAPPVAVVIPNGSWAGLAVALDRGDTVVVLHVAETDRACAVRALPHGRAWMRGPVEACVAVLERGVTAFDGRRRQDPRSVDVGRWPGLDDLRITFGTAPGTSLPEGVRSVVRAAARRVVLDMVAAALTDEVAALVRLAVAPDDGPLDVDDLVAVRTCAALPNPAWVADGLRRMPALAGLLVRPHSTMAVPSPHLRSLADGAAPATVLRDALSPMLREDADRGRLRKLPRAALRSLGQLRDLGAVTQGDFAWVARALRTCFEAAPRRRHLDRADMDVLVATMEDWSHRPLPRGLDLVDTLSEHGRLSPLPRDLIGPWRALRDSVSALSDATGVPLDGTDFDVVTGSVVFPVGRRVAALRRLDARWHASLGAHRAALAVLRAAQASRRAGGRGGDLATAPHFLRETVVVDGITVRPLRTVADFDAHGAAMGHCVASYAARALEGCTFVVALSDPEGGASTVAFRLGGRCVEVEEHRGVANAEPPPLHQAVVDSLDAVVDMGEVARRLLFAERDRRSALGMGARDLDAGAMTAEERATYLDLHAAVLRPWLPGPERDLAPADWLRARVAAVRGKPGPTPTSKLRRLVTAPFRFTLEPRRDRG